MKALFIALVFLFAIALALKDNSAAEAQALIDETEALMAGVLNTSRGKSTGSTRNSAPRNTPSKPKPAAQRPSSTPRTPTNTNRNNAPTNQRAPTNTPSTRSNGSTTRSRSCRVSYSFPLYKQCNSQWRNNRLGRDSTICKAGCLMASVAMALAGVGNKINCEPVNPATLNAHLIANSGYQGNLFVWGSVSRFGLRHEGRKTNMNTIIEQVCDDKIVLLRVKGSSKGQHWVLVTGVNGDTFSVLDAGYDRSTYSAREIEYADIYSFTGRVQNDCRERPTIPTIPTIPPKITIPPVKIPPVKIPPVKIPPRIPPVKIPPRRNPPKLPPVRIPPVKIPPRRNPPRIPPVKVPPRRNPPRVPPVKIPPGKVPRIPPVKVPPRRNPPRIPPVKIPPGKIPPKTRCKRCPPKRTSRCPKKRTSRCPRRRSSKCVSRKVKARRCANSKLVLNGKKNLALGKCGGCCGGLNIKFSGKTKLNIKSLEI